MQIRDSAKMRIQKSILRNSRSRTRDQECRILQVFGYVTQRDPGLHKVSQAVDELQLSNGFDPWVSSGQTHLIEQLGQPIHLYELYDPLPVRTH